MHNTTRSNTHGLLGRLAQAVADNTTEHVEDYARLDLGRTQRKGVPEVVLAERKTPEQTVGIVQNMLANSGFAIVSRVPAPTVVALQAALDGAINMGAWHG